MRLIYLNEQKVKEMQLKKKLIESHEYYLLSQFINRELQCSHRLKKQKQRLALLCKQEPALG